MQKGSWAIDTVFQCRGGSREWCTHLPRILQISPSSLFSSQLHYFCQCCLVYSGVDIYRGLGFLLPEEPHCLLSYRIVKLRYFLVFSYNHGTSCLFKFTLSYYLSCCSSCSPGLAPDRALLPLLKRNTHKHSDSHCILAKTGEPGNSSSSHWHV